MEPRLNTTLAYNARRGLRFKHQLDSFICFNTDYNMREYMTDGKKLSISSHDTKTLK